MIAPTSPISASSVHVPWRWALGGAVMAALATALYCAPAAWLAQLVAGASAGQALAAKGLYADDGANLVAVDVDVAHSGAFGDAFDGGVDARVDAQGQTKPGGVDLVDHGVKVRCFPADDVQGGAEVFAGQQVK